MTDRWHDNWHPRTRANDYVPAGRPDYLNMQSLADLAILPGIPLTYDGRPAVVCVPPVREADHVLIRYLDDRRERVLVSPYECAVGVEW